MTMFINGNEQTATKSKTFFLIANIHISLQLQKSEFEISTNIPNSTKRENGHLKSAYQT